MGESELNNRSKSRRIPIVNQLNAHLEEKHFFFLFGSSL